MEFWTLGGISSSGDRGADWSDILGILVRGDNLSVLPGTISSWIVPQQVPLAMVLESAEQGPPPLEDLGMEQDPESPDFGPPEWLVPGTGLAPPAEPGMEQVPVEGLAPAEPGMGQVPESPHFPLEGLAPAEPGMEQEPESPHFPLEDFAPPAEPGMEQVPESAHFPLAVPPSGTQPGTVAVEHFWVFRELDIYTRL